MTVYVDELTVYPNAKGPFKKGSCHLTADSDEELHAFAALIGMKRWWFQVSSVAPHYDLVASRRALAVKLGAVEETNRAGALRRRRARLGPCARADCPWWADHEGPCGPLGDRP